ncbi:MAG: hypothetical protein WCH85_04785 [Methanomicrobiales archaeon]
MKDTVIGYGTPFSLKPDQELEGENETDKKVNGFLRRRGEYSLPSGGGSTGNGANARQKSFLKSIFLKKGQYPSEKTVQFSGLSIAPFLYAT